MKFNVYDYLGWFFIALSFAAYFGADADRITLIYGGLVMSNVYFARSQIQRLAEARRCA